MKHIILLNQFDHVQIQQMVGRKRFDVDDENDRLTVWFTTESKGILKRTLGRLNDSIDICVKYKIIMTKWLIISEKQLNRILS